MRVLILGGAGMLGHKLWQSYRDRFETWVTVRASYHDYARFDLFDPRRTVGGVEAFDFDSVVRVLAGVQPQVVINCIGIIKQLPTAHDPIMSLTVNSLLPQRLANLCRASRARLIHISTDCVFNGRAGHYTEDDVSDAEDLYGRSKYLGEVNTPDCLTLRTSIIGRELQTASGLVEWFLSRRGQAVKGYRQAIYSGFTTLALARIVADVIERQPKLSGLYHVSSEPINKYDLLCLIRAEMHLPIEVEADDAVQIDRSLDSSRFRSAAGFTPPSWQEMIREMAQDSTPYDQWHSIDPV
jgi:dTDP-4-dehydrorhamnose reductase